MQLPPGKPQFVRRPIHQFANLAVHLGMPAPPGRLVRAPPRPGTRDGPPECGRAKRRRLAVSYARRLGDAVDPAALLCGGSEGEAELLLQSPREDAAHRVALRSAVRSSVSSSAGLRVGGRARKTRRRTPRAKPMIADGGRLGAARRDFVSPFPAPPLDFT